MLQTDGVGGVTWEPEAASLGDRFGRVLTTIIGPFAIGNAEVLIDQFTPGNSKGALIFPAGSDVGSSFEYTSDGDFVMGAGGELLRFTFRDDAGNLLFNTTDFSPQITLLTTRPWTSTVKIWITNIIADQAVLAWSQTINYHNANVNPRIEIFSGVSAGGVFDVTTDTTMETFCSFRVAPHFDSTWTIRFGRFLRLV